MKTGWMAIMMVTGALTFGAPAALADDPTECVEAYPVETDDDWIELFSSSEWVHFPPPMGGGEVTFDVALPVTTAVDGSTWVFGIITCITEDPTGTVMRCVEANLTNPEGFVQCLEQSLR